MKGVDLYAQVRFAVQIEGVSRREAARRFGIDPMQGYQGEDDALVPPQGAVYRTGYIATTRPQAALTCSMTMPRAVTPMSGALTMCSKRPTTGSARSRRDGYSSRRRDRGIEAWVELEPRQHPPNCLEAVARDDPQMVAGAAGDAGRKRDLARQFYATEKRQKV
jgi:hypothetical protein